MNMYFNIRYIRSVFIIMVIAGCCLFFTSCKKFLEQEPSNRLSIDDVFKNFEGAITTLVGTYGNLKSTNYYERNFWLFADLTGGNIKYARSNDPALLNSYSFSNTNQAAFNDMTGFYEIAYNTIYRANNILAYAPGIPDANQLQKNRMLADAYMFRALAHFDLVRVFAQPYNFTADASHEGVVIRTKNTLGTVPVEPPASVKQVYDQILFDLDSSLVLYSNSVPIYQGGSDKTWFSLDAARAIKMRVLLYKEDWNGVVALANLLATSAYPLISNTSYVNSWRRTASPNMDSEAIFTLFARIDQNQGSFGDNFNPGNTIFGYMATSNDLLSLFPPQDVRNRNSMFVTATVANQNHFFTRKYQGRNDSADNQKLIRISEVYLSRAEAYAELNNLPLALIDLNGIRQRANATLPLLNLTNKQEVLDSIFVERRRELCFEGHGLFDITRKKRDLVRNDCVGTNCNINFPSSLFAVPKPTQR
jgi:starch-binding outer membrane protein, SusD/RagB family